MKKKESPIIRRRESKDIGIFIDGVALDRATRRLGKKISWEGLVKSFSRGRKPLFVRYYTVIPFEDDARQHSFLDSIQRAGIEVIVKRLPPIGIDRQVTSDVEMTADITAFGLGVSSLPATSGDLPKNNLLQTEDSEAQSDSETKRKRCAIIITPNREIAYSIQILSSVDVETIICDFESPQTKELLQAASNFTDLSTSETIWRE